MKKVVVINGHPVEGKLSDALASAYIQGLDLKPEQVELVELRKLDFNALRVPDGQTAEPDLLRVQKLISDASHLCVVFPTWWTSVPALLKGFFDLTFISGWAFQYSNGFPKGLLAGRSARIIHTCGAPGWLNKWYYGEPEIKMVKNGILGFCGISPVKVTKIGGIMGAKPGEGTHGIAAARLAGQQDRARLLS